MTKMSTIESAAHGLADARERHRRQEAVVKELEAELMQVETFRRLVSANSAIVDLRKEITHYDDLLREAALDAYHVTGQKNVAAGVSIKVYKTLVYEPGAALAWAKEHAPALVLEVLDKKGFEKTALVLGAPVEEVEEPRVTVAKDLGGWLTEDD